MKSMIKISLLKKDLITKKSRTDLTKNEEVNNLIISRLVKVKECILIFYLLTLEKMFLEKKYGMMLL